MGKQRKGLSWQITLYLGVVVSFLMGFFLLVDYFSQQELVLYYRAEFQKGSVESAVHDMARHMLSRRTAYMAFILNCGDGRYLACGEGSCSASTKRYWYLPKFISKMTLNLFQLNRPPRVIRRTKS